MGILCCSGQRKKYDEPGAAQDVLKDLAGMCGNQQGSRQVQELLIRATREEVSSLQSCLGAISLLSCRDTSGIGPIAACSLAPASGLALH